MARVRLNGRLQDHFKRPHYWWKVLARTTAVARVWHNSKGYRCAHVDRL